MWWYIFSSFETSKYFLVFLNVYILHDCDCMPTFFTSWLGDNKNEGVFKKITHKPMDPYLCFFSRPLQIGHPCIGYRGVSPSIYFLSFMNLWSRFFLIRKVNMTSGFLSTACIGYDPLITIFCAPSSYKKLLDPLVSVFYTPL